MVEIESMYHTSDGNKKPYLVAIKHDAALVIDTVRGDGIDLDSAHDAKTRYYGLNSGLAMKMRQRHPAVSTLEYTTVTLNWRGV